MPAARTDIPPPLLPGGKAPVTIETERLTARRLSHDDIDSLMRIIADPEAMRFYPKVYTRDEAENLWLAKTLSRYEQYGFAFLAWHLKSTGEFVGQCGLLPQIVEGVLEMEVGYLLVTEHWHKGYATEAARASRDYGFKNYDVPHIISLIDPDNIASIRVAERNGMTFDRNAYYTDFLHAVYKITRKEWENL